jgi:hypothetical protein
MTPFFEPGQEEPPYKAITRTSEGNVQPPGERSKKLTAHPISCKLSNLSALLLLSARFASGSNQEWRGKEDFIAKGKMEIQLASGPLFSAKIFGNGTPTTNAWQSSLRLGWILNNPKQKEWFLGGSLEAIIEVPYALIYQGPGNYWVGITGLLRYHFVPPDSKWIPYVQVGAGVVHIDVYKDYSQDAIGQATEFNPQASLGIRFFLKKNGQLILKRSSCIFPTRILRTEIGV